MKLISDKRNRAVRVVIWERPTGDYRVNCSKHGRLHATTVENTVESAEKTAGSWLTMEMQRWT